MVNDHNLIPMTERSPSEAREMGRKGGIASGKTRRQQADLKRAFRTILGSEVNNEQLRELLLSLGYEPTNEMALALVVMQKALNGDMTAFKGIQQMMADDDRGSDDGSQVKDKKI